MLTVVTPAASRKLTTLENLKAELGIPSSAEDVRLGRLIGRASDIISGHCDRTFGRETVRLDVHGWSCEPGIRLRGGPLEVVSVAAGGTDLQPGDWQFDGEEARLYRLSGAAAQRILWPGQATAITYRRGYVLPGDDGYEAAGRFQLPGDVEQACITLVTSLRAGSRRDPMLRSESSEGLGAQSYIATADMGALPPQVVGLLERFVRYSVA